MSEKERPHCIHCKQEMRKWSTPSFNFGDGLGWPTDFLYVCFNDECSFYMSGWERMMERYRQHASYRFMIDPSTGESGSIPVFTPHALKGNIISDEEARKAEREA